MSSEKTEMPTPKRLRDARKKGQVSKSTDVVSTALLIGLYAYIGAGWNSHVKNLMQLMIFPIQYMSCDFKTALSQVMPGVLSKTFLTILPVLGITMLFAIAANCAQIGLLFAPEVVKPDFKKINPMEKLKHIFSKKNLFEFLKSTLKIIFLSILIYLVIKHLIHDLLLLPFTEIKGTYEILGPIMRRFAYNVIFAYVVVAALDFIFQKRDFMKKMMMSKEEVKREYKESEGDPQIKSKRKQLHREMIEQGGAAQKTKQSSVLVTNPEHMAVAIYYNVKSKGLALPIVVAKGKGHIAEEMIEIARRAGIPIMRNVPLAHSLMDSAEIMQYIPTELIEPVAEVLRWVYEMKEQHEQGIGLEGEMQ
ncbi:MAG: type III secretion system export apparatus subunit SctU [Puniceicoccales bacterium]|jgi:type III secretion protein U|nr:type III secretion system export apparatus subunit SctU [Puniceicoccales bacterium]